MSDDIVNRLRCRYASGPIINGEPEFGYRDTSGPMEVILPTPIMKEAADEIERLRAEVAGLQIKADLFDLAVRKGLLSVHSELIDPRNHGTRCSWLEGHAKACDISNNAALAARKGEA